MQNVSNGDNLHELSNPVYGENKKNIINLSAAELAQKVVKVNLLKLDPAKMYLKGIHGW